MNIALKHYVVLLSIAVPLLAACSGKKDYSYYRNHLDEAKSFSGECQLNGTSGMEKDVIFQCDAARQAYNNRNYNY